MELQDIPSDTELLARLKVGDRDAFNQIYYRHSQSLYQFAFNVLRNEDECTDTIQDIFAWLWQNRQKIEVTSLKGYLCAAVKYKLARVIQRSKRQMDILSANPVVNTFIIEEELEVKELKTAINIFTETLPSRAKQIFKLSRNEYFSNKEIALQLHISEKTVENQMTITLRKLKANLGKLSFWAVLF